MGYPEVSAFILAGGASTRMGREKGLLDFGGEPLVVRIARLLEPLAQEIIVIGTPERYSPLGLRAIADRSFLFGSDAEPVHSPLVGIATALSVTTSPWNLMLACDMPYLTREWIGWLLQRTVQSSAQAVMPKTSRGLEPLAAAYRKECAAQLIAALENGIRKVTDATSELRAEVVHENEWRSLDPDDCVLRNMNTPADYRLAKEWWESGPRRP